LGVERADRHLLNLYVSAGESNWRFGV